MNTSEATPTPSTWRWRKDLCRRHGLIVFNEVTYPNFVKLLRRLDVPWKPSRMSFSLRCEQTGLEYSPSFSGRPFCPAPQHAPALSTAWSWTSFVFAGRALKLLEARNDHVTLGDYLKREKYSPLFVEKFILPWDRPSGLPIRSGLGSSLPATSWSSFTTTDS